MSCGKHGSVLAVMMCNNDTTSLKVETRPQGYWQWHRRALHHDITDKAAGAKHLTMLSQYKMPPMGALSIINNRH